LFRTRLAASFDQGTQRLSLPYPVLSGSDAHPDMTVDCYAMEPSSDLAARSLRALTDALTAVTVEVATEPGDLLIIDNRVVAHGRTPFTPRYDGHDRWLRRVFVVADLRRSASARAGFSHVIGPLSAVEEAVTGETLALADHIAQAREAT
jgi:L-asparagine oxygenase